MGRQIAIIAAWQDELAILRKIAELAESEVRVFRNADAGDSRKSLWIDDWESTPIRDPMYGIWPTRFAWKPKYWQIKPPCDPNVANKWRFANDGVAPVIELSRPFRRNEPGRLYWSKYFTATEPLAYDVEAFDRVISGLWRWIRKVGVANGEDAYRRTFVLPHAR